MDPIELSIFARRIDAVCEEMGAQLRFAAFSPNIRDRLDYSCAVFDPQGGLCAQAAHIPVHLGSMAYAMQQIVAERTWLPGDFIALNDPYLGGTHLPDVTVVCPVFIQGQLTGFVANRAHHADIGAETPGSMPVSTSLSQEGVVIPPTQIGCNGEIDQQVIRELFRNARNLRDTLGDIAAQCSANRLGIQRLAELVGSSDREQFLGLLSDLNDYGRHIARSVVAKIPNGTYSFTDYMEDDGQGSTDLAISVSLQVHDRHVEVDFSGTAMQADGNINCPISVTAAAVSYVFRCLMPKETPACAGSFSPFRLQVPSGSLLNAHRPAAVAAGNVETSSRIVDAVLGALSQALPDAIPACSQGTMNNLALGSSTGQAWGYYETIAGGMGGSMAQPGLSAVHTHMTNTQNTPVEVLEINYPLRVTRYAIRNGSGGPGQHDGGDGLIRELEFLDSATFTVLSERRTRPPWGLNGGHPGQAGGNYLNGERMPGKVQRDVRAGDCLRIESPGGGGWGSPV
ncbi:MAG: hydantoinase B/oxoprolinase family protein [Gammaproteobacteria bacterium]|nr:hydantoinase B/oxoprolinase family protein [Gammaproteobacteria bacterium]